MVCFLYLKQSGIKNNWFFFFFFCKPFKNFTFGLSPNLQLLSQKWTIFTKSWVMESRSCHGKCYVNTLIKKKKRLWIGSRHFFTYKTSGKLFPFGGWSFELICLHSKYYGSYDSMQFFYFFDELPSWSVDRLWTCLNLKLAVQTL